MPDIITRVSEYVPEIIKFVKQLLENGFAYEGKHSEFYINFSKKVSIYAKDRVKN